MAGKTRQIGKSLGTDAAKDGAYVDTPSAEAFAAKAKDLDALREAVVDAAGVGAGLWLSYLFLFFYLFIAVAAVTHRDFLFENPVKLPFLDVELPLLGFFVLGPLLFLILHAYVLLHFAMFADKVGVFHSELRAQIGDEDTRSRLRRQLPSNIFVQYLAGPNEVRTGIMGFMLRLIALITLVIFPIALLVFFQLQFLPYHDAPIAWWLRITVLLDILLLWTLWPSIARGQTSWISWHDFRRPKIIAFLFASLVPLLLVFTIATFPGEWLDSNLPSLPLVPTYSPSLKFGSAEEERWRMKGRWQKVVESMKWISLHDMLVAGDVDLIARKPTSLWSNRLVLPGIDVIDHATSDSEEKIGALRETLSLRGRRLERAVLISSSLRKVDLTAARLQGAVLLDADLREAKLSCAGAWGEEGFGPQDCVQLQGADLTFANLQGANLREAQLQGAILGGAQLPGADLSRAHLQGANLTSANLQGADLREARLQGANLDSARLQGADLFYAHLQGANLISAELQGADLTQANLQGADLREARLQGADLSGTKVWLASFPDHHELQSPVPLGVADLDMSPPTGSDTMNLYWGLHDDITDGELLKTLHDRLKPVLGNYPEKEKWEDEGNWKSYVKPSREMTVAFLARIACEDPGGHIAIAIAERAIDGARMGRTTRDYAKPLAQELLRENCEGAKALTDTIRATLENLVSATESGHGDAASAHTP